MITKKQLTEVAKTGLDYFVELGKKRDEKSGPAVQTAPAAMQTLLDEQKVTL